ncbi:hypothetical protein CDD82_5827 [Ophiocordyceps australis]|uniref:Cysteine-rich transmembrane domain-containing protein n=1 Tax=Ophiocordyceps australis TaxID=1399860 RepID=A0A2C5ZT11_9HYPO|nr:hypothetical protein CDD82_5827 [Ophiocordyceps australis]
MARKGEEPPPYGVPPQAPKPTFDSGPSQQQAQYNPGQPSSYNQQPQGAYYQPGPQMGYYNQQQGPYPAGQGPYPPQGQYPPGPGYVPQQRNNQQKVGMLEGLLAGLACCCCLDIIF